MSWYSSTRVDSAGSGLECGRPSLANFSWSFDLGLPTTTGFAAAGDCGGLSASGDGGSREGLEGGV